MNEELEQILNQKILELKEIVTKYGKQLYGDNLQFERIELEEEIIEHFISGEKERKIELYAKTNKGYFDVKKSYPIEENKNER